MNNRRGSSGMGGLADRTADETNAALQDEEIKLLLKTSIDWESMRPKVTDSQVFEKLMKAVKEATDHNNDIAILKSRIKELGQAGVEIAKKVIALT